MKYFKHAEILLVLAVVGCGKSGPSTNERTTILPSTELPPTTAECSDEPLKFDSEALRTVHRPIFPTPKDAFSTLQKGFEEKDFSKVIAATTVESQRENLGAFFVYYSMSSPPDSLNPFFERFGVDTKGINLPSRTLWLGRTGDRELEQRLREIARSAEDPTTILSDAVTRFYVGTVDFLNRKHIDQQMLEFSVETDFVGANLAPVKVTGAQAFALMKTSNGRIKQIEFRKQADSWLVHLPPDESQRSGHQFGVYDILTRAMDSPLIGNDVDQFEENDMEFWGDHFALPLPNARRIEELNDDWKTSVNYADEPAIGIVMDLAAQCGLRVIVPPAITDSLWQDVTVKLDDVSRLQVFEAVCQQLEIYPRYNIRTVTFCKGPRPYPAVFTGPFLVTVGKLQENISSGKGLLDIEFFATGLPMDIPAHLTRREHYPVDLVGCPVHIHGDGVELNTDGPKSEGCIIANSSSVKFVWPFKLKGLSESIKAIDPINATITWQQPTKITRVKFVAGVAKLGDIKMKLEGESKQFIVRLKGGSNEDIELGARDANGKPLYLFTFNSHLKEVVKCKSTEGLNSLEAQSIDSAETVSYRFQFPPIRLHSNAHIAKPID